VAVAANLAAVGLGTDTCGSVRLPAARNNLYALRPTSGLSSRTGVIPLSPTLDAVGPITRNVIDLAILLDATAGEDPDDPTTVAVDAAYAEAVDSEGLTGRRIGLVSFPAGSEAADPLERALEEVAANGAEVIAVTVPDEPDRDPYAFMNEFGSAMDDYLAARPEGMFRSVKDIAAFYLDHPDVSQDLPPLVATLETDTYREAVERRPLFREGIIAFMDEHDLDAIAYPAAAIGGASEPFDCESAAMGGLPAIVIPAGFTALGLPIGLELMGRPFDEATLIAIAAGYEAHTDHRMLPPTTPPLASVS
jgi:Asp-tRNA(Asn)/Glu-tRNA(Gln) amidotransferase A subunit family amidase